EDMFCATSGFSAESNEKNAGIRDTLNGESAAMGSSNGKVSGGAIAIHGSQSNAVLPESQSNAGLSGMPDSKRVFLSCGIAPQTAQDIEKIHDLLPLWIEQYRAFKPDAIGEIGLDWHWGKTDLQRNRQIWAFEYQLELASRLGIPVVIHCRDAMPEVLSRIESYNIKKFMMHCFSGTQEDALKSVELGGIISVPPLRNKDRKKAVKAVGLERLVAETDSPYIGKTLNDINVSLQIISDSLSVSLDVAAESAFRNALQFYGGRD
ncbi:MAG TPA: TatD family hydrolase, partial [Candidatus Micrarchaeota archaeon]|nr:TatD family hydrolase [Candidatus Micrarchaeota archaeon]